MIKIIYTLLYTGVLSGIWWVAIGKPPIAVVVMFALISAAWVFNLLGWLGQF